MAQRFIWMVMIFYVLSLPSLYSCATLKPAEFNVYSVDVNRKEVAPWENITVTAIIGNSGGIADNYTAILNMDGKEKDRQTISIKPSENRTIFFSMGEQNIGEHIIEIGSGNNEFSVYKPTNYLLEYGNYFPYVLITEYNPSTAITYKSRMINTQNPNGLWIKYKPPTIPFQINKIYIYGQRTNIKSDDNKIYTIKIWSKEFGKELFSGDYPYSSFPTDDIKVVEHEITPPISVDDDFIVDFISHNTACPANIATTSNNSNLVHFSPGKFVNNCGIYVCVGKTDYYNQNIGLSRLGQNDVRTWKQENDAEPDWAYSYWGISVSGNCKNVQTQPIDKTPDPLDAWILYPNNNVECDGVGSNQQYPYQGADGSWLRPDTTYTQESRTGFYRGSFTIINKHDKWDMTQVQINGVPIVDRIKPGQKYQDLRVITVVYPPGHQQVRWKWEISQ